MRWLGVAIYWALLAAVLGRVGLLCLRVLRRYTADLNAGLIGVRTSWRAWLTFAHAAAVPVAVAYLAITVGNSVAFGYSFWSEPAPSAAANTVATISLFVLPVLACVVGTATYGWMCRQCISSERNTLLADLRVSVRAATLGAWGAVPAFALTVILFPVVVPCVPLVALFGSAPFRSLGQPRAQLRTYAHFVRHEVGSLMAIAAVFSVAAIPIDGLAIAGSFIVTGHPWPIEYLAVLIAWAGLMLVVLAAGWAASAFASVWSRYDADPRPRS
jgi:hypothetical protein